MTTPETWEAFVGAYRRQVGGVARIICQRWTAPSAVARDDVEQEVWLGAWLAWERWRPGRGGMSRAAYALCSGRLDAQRWIHTQRNAPRRSGSAPGRYPVLWELGDSQGGARCVSHAESPIDCAMEQEQETAVAFGEAVRDALRSCRTRRERRELQEAVTSGFSRAGSMVAAEKVRRAFEAR